MSKKNITNSIIQKIKDQHITPKSRWTFLLKEYSLWGALIIILAVGAVAASVTIFRFATNDWDIHPHLGQSFPIYFFQNLPFFWLGLLLVFLLIAYYDFRHTKQGYKISLPFAIVTTSLISISLGFVLFGLGAAKHIENGAQYLPFYSDPRIENWNHPMEGLLAGEILEVIDPQNFTLESFREEVWEIRIEELPPRFQSGMVVGLIGEKLDENIFNATEVRPWKGNMPPGKGHPNMMRNLMKEKMPAPRMN